MLKKKTSISLDLFVRGFSNEILVLTTNPSKKATSSVERPKCAPPKRKKKKEYQKCLNSASFP